MEIKTDFTWTSDPTVRLSYCGGEGDKRPVLIVLPGGGYAVSAPNEGAPIAERFAELGYAAFVLYYSTSYQELTHNENDYVNLHTRFPEPLRELASAVAYIRNNADKFGADAEKLIIMGFSAGGHLAANYVNLWSSADVYEGIADPDMLRPSVCVLGYGATELDPDSMMLPAIFESAEVSPPALKRYSARYHIGPQTPPTFLFHSVTDPVVAVQQSIDMAQALENAGIPYELHLFGCGAHAYGLGEGSRPGEWVGLADSFIKHILCKPESYDKAAVAEKFHF